MAVKMLVVSLAAASNRFTERADMMSQSLVKTYEWTNDITDEEETTSQSIVGEVELGVSFNMPTAWDSD